MIKTVREINPAWSDYDKSVARCHMENYGVIYLDEFDCPIDNEYELEELEREGKELKLGRVVMTRRVAVAATQSLEFNSFIAESFGRYMRHDWGNMCKKDKKANTEALKNGDRILASYDLPGSLRNVADDDKIWIITEWDRSVTTVLFPSEY